MSELPRKAVARTAKLAALPLGYAGRTALGLGKRIGGASAESVLTEVQQRTAEQLFRTLGDLKGGAMKFGQAMSIFEAALPDEIAAPYREHLTRLQDSAPPMPTMTVREILARELGPDWKDHLVWFDAEPAAAASIGQVHRGRWADGREVAVKVQYPGSAEALTSDLRQLSRVARGLGPLVPGLDIRALIAEVQDRAIEELDYQLEAEAQRDVRGRVPRRPRHRGARRGAGVRHGPGHRVDGEHRLAGPRHPRGHPGRARPLRPAVRALHDRRPSAHRPAPRRPAPGQLPDHPQRRRLTGPARRARLRRRRPAPRPRAAALARAR